MIAHEPFARALKITAAIALVASSAWTIKAMIAAHHACWGDVVILPRQPRGQPQHNGFEKLAEQGYVKPNKFDPDSTSVLLGDVNVDYAMEDYNGGDRVGRVPLGYVVWRIAIPSSCSVIGPPEYPYFSADPPYALWYDRERDVYRINSALGPTSMDAVDFRRVPRPGYVLVNPPLRLANSLALVLGVVSYGVGWLKGWRWLLAALLLAGVAVLLSRCG
jgi:hypothetical protein